MEKRGKKGVFSGEGGEAQEVPCTLGEQVSKPLRFTISVCCMMGAWDFYLFEE